MRKTFVILAAAVMVAAAIPAFAELQTVQVGGEVRIRMNYYNDAIESGSTPFGWRVVETPPGSGRFLGVRFPAFTLGNRPIGVSPLGGAILSPFAFSDDVNSLSFVEQRTRLSVKADFTNEVSAFIELDSYDIWGEDFRSDWVTGADGRAVSDDDVEVLQAYIEANEMWGMPLRARIGRQELKLGSGWLVGTGETNSLFTGLSFDGIRLTYATDMFSVDAMWAKLFETGNAEEDGDVDLYGVYGSYLGLEDITIDAYWLWVRDARAINDTSLSVWHEWWEDLWGFDDYDVTNMHTFGLRGAGMIGGFDFEAEAAYQWGDSSQVGQRFAKYSWLWFGPFPYGDDDSDYDRWAGNLEVGYTFDMAWTPRVWVGAAYFDGSDNRDVNFWNWINPFDTNSSSVSFNRLFSDWEYSQFLDVTGDMSNFWTARGGVEVMPTESIEAELSVAYLSALETFEAPWYGDFLGWRWFCPMSIIHPWMTSETDDELGWEVALSGTYHYSEDLTFAAGGAYLFPSDGLEEGSFTQNNGLLFNGGRDDEEAAYLWAETRISF
jgi:hypothetical protein